MKKFIAIVLCLGLGYGVQAQHGHVVAAYRAPVYVYRPSLSFGVGYFAPFYSPFGYYGFPYSGFYPSAGYSRPTRLQRQEDDIRSDYEDRIYSVRQDNSLTNKQKRQTVRSLKKQRDQEIHDLVVNYHKQPVTPQTPEK